MGFHLLIESFFTFDETGTRHMIFHWRTPTRPSTVTGADPSVYRMANGQVANKISDDDFEFDNDGTPTRLRRSQ